MCKALTLLTKINSTDKLPAKKSSSNKDKTLFSQGVSCPALHQAKPCRKLNKGSIHDKVGHLDDLQHFSFCQGAGGWSSSAPTGVSDRRKQEAG